MAEKQKTIVIGAGPVGALAAIYAAQRGHEVEVYEFRGGRFFLSLVIFLPFVLFVLYVCCMVGVWDREIQVFSCHRVVLIVC